jgi:hypothetical protein
VEIAAASIFPKKRKEEKRREEKRREEIKNSK